MKRKQQVLTPYWDRYVQVYEKEREGQEEPKLSKQVRGLVRVLKPKDKRELYEWLRRECENVRI